MTERKLDYIEHFQSRLRIAKEAGDKAKEGSVCRIIGIAYHRRGNFTLALEYFKTDLSIAKELGNKIREGHAYGNLGIAYSSLGDFQEAIVYHEKDLSIAKELGDRDGEGKACGNLGGVYQSLGDFKRAIEYHEKNLSIAKEVRNRTGEGRNLGNAYHSLGDFQEAIVYHQKDLSIAKEMGDEAGEGSAYGNLGNAYRRLGDLKGAIYYHELRLNITKDLGDRAAEGRAYGSLGNAYHSLGSFEQAIEYHKEDLRITKEVGDRAGEGRAHGNLGSAYRSLGDFKQAIEHQKLHASIAKDVGNLAGEGIAYGNLGNAFQSLGDLEEAIKYHQRCLSIAKKVEDKAGEGNACGNIGNAYNERGDFQKAMEYQKEYLAIAKEVGDRNGEGRAYGNIGQVYLRLGDFKQAVEYFQKCLDVAKEVSNRAEERGAYGNLGNAYQGLGDFKQAIECHKKGLSIAKEVGDWAGEASACCALGRNFEFSGSLHEALGYYQSSLRLCDKGRALLQSQDEWKISLRDKYQRTYSALWQALIKDSKTDEALCIAEQGRAQALVDLMKSQYGLRSLQFSSNEPKETISFMLSYISTPTVFLAVEGTMVNSWVLCKGNDVTFRRKKINHGEAGENSTTFLQESMENALKKHGVGVDVRCENRSFEDLSDETQSNKESDENMVKLLPGQDNYFHDFYDIIIDPIANLLPGDELIIVPDGPLCLAPYAAFVDHNSRYLCESFRIRLIPSLTSLKLIVNSPSDHHRKSGVLLVGDPCVQEVTNKRGRKCLEQLPCARKEVEMIGRIPNVVPLTGREATKDEVVKRLASVALVHIAAHGRMETGEIALAPNPERKSEIPKEEDYMLTMADVLAVQLRARLVVLSCCHSAKGTVKAEGVVGIARAFLGAGARSVLVSLWAIDDEATMVFMQSLYEHLGDGQSASVALNLAMKCLRESKKYSAMKHGALFVLIGDDITLDFANED